MANANSARTPSSQGGGSVVDFELEDMGTTRSEGGADSAHYPSILVLTRNAGLAETVQKAAPRGAQVVDAPDLDQAASRMATLQPGVLVIDAASASGVPGMVAQLTQNFPELVVVVAGKSEDATALMRLTAAGQIYRFLLTPLSHGQTRLTLEAAIARHKELGAASDRLSSGGDGGGERKNYLPAYVGLGVGIVAVIGGIWWFVSRMAGDEAPQTASTVEQSQQAGANSVPAKQDPVAAELALAKQAFEQGKYIEPAGESALDLYRSALSIDPSSTEARDGVRSVADKILERAEAALLAERLEEAVSSLELARDIEAEHPRLAFLDSQIARERERLKLSQAQEVGTKVRSLLAQASQRMEQDRLLAPAGDSARDALLEARRLDPTDPAVAQAFRDLSARVVEVARQAVAAGQIDQAQTYLTAARQLGSAGSSLAAVERSLSDARNAASKRSSVDSLIANARKRLADGQLIEPAGDSAREAIAAVRAADGSRPELDELSKVLATKLLDSGRQATAAQQFDRAQQMLAASREVGAKYNEAALAQAERDLDQLRKQAASTKTAPSVSAATLKRTKTVTPVFPDSALKKGLSGWVELNFTVTPMGEVADVTVRNSTPEGVFEDAAMKAVRQWRFEPVIRDGQAVSQRTMVRLKFDNPNS